MAAGDALLLINQRLAIKTSTGVYDISGRFAAGTPTPIGRQDVRLLAGMKTPSKTPTQVDMAYQIAQAIIENDGFAHQVRAAMLRSETIHILDYATDEMHWHYGELVVPSSARAEDNYLFSYNWNLEASGDFWQHGELLNDLTSAQAKTGVPAGAHGLVYIKDAGSLTALRLRYHSTSNYDMTISAPAVDIFNAQLETSGGTPIPAARSSGTFTLTPTPANATFDVVIGYGIDPF